MDTLPYVLLDRDAPRRAVIRDIADRLSAREVRSIADAALVITSDPVAAADFAGPILTWGKHAPGLGCVLMPDPFDATFADAVAPWLDCGQSLDRTIRHFGAEAITPLLQRLAGQMQDIMRDPAASTLALHSLGGFAGTLGFRRFAHCAERASLGDESALPALRREAAWALETIAPHLQNHGDRSTMV